MKRTQFEQRHFSRMVKYKAGYRCQICGEFGNTDSLHAHHIDPHGKSTLENGICLCISCHLSLPRNINTSEMVHKRFGSVRNALPRFPRDGKKRKERVEYAIPESSPNWLAKELGIPGQIIRAILRAKYPRPLELKRSRWERLTSEQQSTVRELVKSKISNFDLELNSNVV